MPKKAQKRAELIRQATAAAERAFKSNFAEAEQDITTVEGLAEFWDIAQRTGMVEAEFRRLMDELLKAST